MRKECQFHDREKTQSISENELLDYKAINYSTIT